MTNDRHSRQVHHLGNCKCSNQYCDPTWRLIALCILFTSAAGYSEDSDYTSDLNYPISQAATSSAGQYRSPQKPHYSLEASRENSYEKDGHTYGSYHDPMPPGAMIASDPLYPQPTGYPYENAEVGKDENDPLSYNSQPMSRTMKATNEGRHYDSGKRHRARKMFDENSTREPRLIPGMRKRSLERQESALQYDEYSGYAIGADESLYASNGEDKMYMHEYNSDIVGGGDQMYDDQWDVGSNYGSRTTSTNKQLPQLPMKHSISVIDSMASETLSSAVPVSSSASKKSRRLPQLGNTKASSSSRMLPQMPTRHRIPQIRRCDTEYSDHDSAHSTYSYRPGAVSAIQFNEDYNYAYQSTDSLNTTTQSVLSEFLGDRRSKIAVFSGAVPIVSGATKSAPSSNRHNQTSSFDLGTCDDISSSMVYNNQMIDSGISQVDLQFDQMLSYERDDQDIVSSYCDDYGSTTPTLAAPPNPLASRKRLPATPSKFAISGGGSGGGAAGPAKLLPQLPATPKKLLPTPNVTVKSATHFSIPFNTTYNRDTFIDQSESMNGEAAEAATAGGTASSTSFTLFNHNISDVYSNNNVYGSSNVSLINNNNNKFLDKLSSSDDVNSYSNFNEQIYDDEQAYEIDENSENAYDNYGFYGPKSYGIDEDEDTNAYDSKDITTEPYYYDSINYSSSSAVPAILSSNDTAPIYLGYDSTTVTPTAVAADQLLSIGVPAARASATTAAVLTTAHTSSIFSAAKSTTSAAAFMKSSLSGYASKIATPITSPSGSTAGSGISVAGSLGATLTSSIGMGLSKTLSMFQSKAATTAPSTSATLSHLQSPITMTSGAQKAPFGQPQSYGDIGLTSTLTHGYTPSTMTADAAKPTSALTGADAFSTSDDEMNQVTGNAVDYNINDCKYTYDEYSENDYIATGDIISKKISYNNNNNYTNNYSTNASLDSDGVILNNQNFGNSMTENVNSSQCISENDQMKDSQPPPIDNYDPYGYMSSGNLPLDDPLLSSQHVYGTPHEAAGHNIVLKQQQEIDPNEVYEEDYEEDIIRQSAQQGDPAALYGHGVLAINYHPQTYQSPYYNYQQDYFNEEDEYKYLEKERQEADDGDFNDMEHEQNASHQDRIDDIELETDHNGYQSDDQIIDNSTVATHNQHNKKRHLHAQESISDNDFFMQHFDGPGLKSIAKQECIIEEAEESGEKVATTTTAAAATVTPAAITSPPTIAATSVLFSTAPTAVSARPLSLLAAMTSSTTAQALTATKQPGDIVSDIIGTATIGLDLPASTIQPTPVTTQSTISGIGGAMMGGDATAMMMAAAKLATTATGSATTNKVDDVIDDVNKKKISIKTDPEDAVRKSEITAKQRWNWAYNKIIMQLNVSTQTSFVSRS